MKPICEGCYFNKGSWCNRLVVSGGFGCSDRLASDYLKGNECKYREEGKSKPTSKPNFENS